MAKTSPVSSKCSAPSEPSRLRFSVDTLRAAFAYFSRIPVGSANIAQATWAWAPAHLPLVGICVGGVSTGVLILAEPLGPSLSAALALATSVVVTGALHEDGLADSADALGAAHSGKRALEIMKDSHLGTFGAVAVGLSLLLRYAALVELSAERAFACIAVHGIARLPPVWLLAHQPAVSLSARDGMASRAKVGLSQAVVASLWVAGLCFWLWQNQRLPALVSGSMVLAMLPLTWWAARTCRRAVGGITGDLLGATEQGAEIVAWLVVIGLAS